MLEMTRVETSLGEIHTLLEKLKSQEMTLGMLYGHSIVTCAAAEHPEIFILHGYDDDIIVVLDYAFTIVCTHQSC